MLPAVIVPSPLTIVPLDLVESFLSSLTERTRRAYDGDLRSFASYVGVTSPAIAVSELLEHGPGSANLLALNYRTSMTERRLSPSTIARRLAALRSVVRLARTVGRITWTLDVRSPRAEAYRDTAGPGADGWKAMVSLARENSLLSRPQTARGGMKRAKAARDHAILRLLHDLGLRREEVVELDLAHVDRAPEVHLPTAVNVLGKGRLERERFTLAPRTAEALAAWLDNRGPVSGALFHPLDRTCYAAARLTGQSVALIVRRAGVDVGLPRSVTPHGLRHQAITAALDRTKGDVRRVQRFSRHKDVRTLLRYDDRRVDDRAAISELISED
jgi:integrase/recombinase XerC